MIGFGWREKAKADGTYFKGGRAASAVFADVMTRQRLRRREIGQLRAATRILGLPRGSWRDAVESGEAQHPT